MYTVVTETLTITIYTQTRVIATKGDRIDLPSALLIVVQPLETAETG